MSAQCSVPLGAVCLLFAARLIATPYEPPAAAPVPLREAVRSIWADSPQVQSARADVDAARARARAAAQPIYNPSVSLEAENADVDRRTAGLSLTLDMSGKRRARAAFGSAEVQVSEASFDFVRREIAAHWLKAWSTATLATRQKELGEHRLALMQRFDKLAAQRLKLGDISSPERDLAGLALGEAQVQQAALIGEQATARAALKAVAGEQVGALPDLPDALPPAATRMPSVATDELPELIEARARLASADARVDVARRARIPDPTVSLTGGQVRTGPITDRVIGVNVSVPLPVLNSGRAEVDAAWADADAAASGVRARERSLQAAQEEVTERYTALRDAATAFRNGRAAAFEERAALLEKLWQAGELSTSNYLVQLKQSLDTALSGVALESQTWQAWFDYLTAAGRLTDWIDGGTKEASP